MSTDKCPLTGIDIESKREPYTLEFARNKINVLWSYDCFKTVSKNIKPIVPHHVIKGLIANNKLPDDIFLCLNDCDLKEVSDGYARIVYPGFFETVPYPKTASQKMNNLLEYLYSKQDYDGQGISLNYGNEEFILLNYFKNSKECKFYVDSLVKNNLIEGGGNSDITVKFTIEGLNRIVELEEKSIDSTSCFVAMAFCDETKEYREAIRKALNNNGYSNAVIIDEKHLDSDKTIPDAILNEIRKAKFCIADFTFNSKGVYFESGYALGLGKQVIYTCKDNHVKDVHFDIKQLQHVRYKTPEELEKKLSDKIEFWIK